MGVHEVTRYTVEWWYGNNHTVTITDTPEDLMWTDAPEGLGDDFRAWQEHGAGTYWDRWSWYTVWHGQGTRPERRWEKK